jgi:hypothetical protein
MSMGPARDLGPCILAWGADTLGPYWEEVRFKFDVRYAEVFESTFGAHAVDAVFTGVGECELTVPFTRVTLAQLTALIAGASTSGSSGVVVKDNMIGTTMYDLSKPLFVKPIVAGVAVANGSWLRIDHAYPIPSFDIAYNNKDQRVYNVMFKAFPDATTRKTWGVGKVPTGTT